MVVVLSKAEDHVPVTPFSEVVGNDDKLSPLHIGATAAKVGMIFGLTFTITESVDVQPVNISVVVTE